jgi:hypothetical protein
VNEVLDDAVADPVGAGEVRAGAGTTAVGGHVTHSAVRTAGQAIEQIREDFQTVSF